MSRTERELPEDQEECDACGFTTRDLHWVEPYGGGPVQKGWVCTICWSTMSGNAFQYPEQYRANGEVLHMIAFCTNTILEAMGHG